MRNHRLRERRLALGATQYLIGCLAGLAPSTVSFVERGIKPSRTRDVRAAIVYLEMKPRRMREAARQEAIAVARTEAALASGDGMVIIDRLVDLLWDGRCDDFDALAERVPAALAERAGDIYLDACKPKQGA